MDAGKPITGGEVQLNAEQ